MNKSYNDKENTNDEPLINKLMKEKLINALSELNSNYYKLFNFKTVRCKIINSKYKYYIFYIDDYELIVAYEKDNPFYNNKLLKSNYNNKEEIINAFIDGYTNYNIM